MKERKKTMTTITGIPVGDNQNSLTMGRMKSVGRRIQARQIQHFFKADPDYGRGVAEGLGHKLRDIVAA